jgi:SNF2 family DNA or RNA helicase
MNGDLRNWVAMQETIIRSGAIDPATRQRNVDNFMKNPKYKVFIGNIQAAGTAITLTSAHNIVFIEQDWVPGNNAQAAMRVHRIGQTKPVHVRVLYLPDTIDEKIARILKCKTRDLIALFDEGILES